MFSQGDWMALVVILRPLPHHVAGLLWRRFDAWRILQLWWPVPFMRGERADEWLVNLVLHLVLME